MLCQFNCINNYSTEKCAIRSAMFELRAHRHIRARGKGGEESRDAMLATPFWFESSRSTDAPWFSVLFLQINFVLNVKIVRMRVAWISNILISVYFRSWKRSVKIIGHIQGWRTPEHRGACKFLRSTSESLHLSVNSHYLSCCRKYLSS